MVADAKMHKNKTKAEMLIWSNPNVSMDIDNCNICYKEKTSLLNRNRLSKVKPFNHMVNRMAHFEIIPHVEPYKSICFYC